MYKVLSIVIPSYNMQDYLRKCLDSLIGSKHLQDLDILVVNDGSTDDTSLIAHEYESEYPGIIRVIDKENGHYGSCVNRGLLEAKGKYIKILDADDWFDTAALDKYVLTLKSVDGVDLVITDYQDVKNDGVTIKKQSFNIPQNAIVDFKDIEETNAVFFIHSLTYRTEFLRSIGYRQTEGISYTDCEWSYIPMAHVDKFVYLPFDIYRYRLGREGQSMDPTVLKKTVKNHIAVSKRIIHYYDSLPVGSTSDRNYQRADNEVLSISKKIYKICLVEQSQSEFHDSKLGEYDMFLKNTRPTIYWLLEHLTLNGFPFRYVRFWHRFGFRFPLAGIRDIVRKIRYSS